MKLFKAEMRSLINKLDFNNFNEGGYDDGFIAHLGFGMRAHDPSSVKNSKTSVFCFGLFDSLF